VTVSSSGTPAPPVRLNVPLPIAFTSPPPTRETVTSALAAALLLIRSAIACCEVAALVSATTVILLPTTFILNCVGSESNAIILISIAFPAAPGTTASNRRLLRLSRAELTPAS